MTNKDISGLRKEYALHRINDEEIFINPFMQFGKWFEEAAKTDITEVNAMNLATASKEGKVRNRMVLLKSFDEEGFVFYTNYESVKAHHLSENPYASINFFWYTLERQVTIEGKVVKVDAYESMEYFTSRPRGSQIAAHVSDPQSGKVPDRQYLEEHYKLLADKFEGKPIPKPDCWGGYRIIPDRMEFWQGRPNRLHDRIEYYLDEHGDWQNRRLAP